MIAALALLATGVGNPVAEWPAPSASYVSVQAVVKLPVLSPSEVAEARLLAETLDEEVEAYSRRDMRELSARVGSRLTVQLMPDHLSISIGVPPSEAGVAVGYVTQLLRNSKLPAAALDAAIADLPFRKRSIWGTAIQPEKLSYARIRRADVVELYHRICRPENVWLAVGGPVVSGEAQRRWEAAIEDWKLPVVRAANGDQFKAPEIVPSVPGRENILELRGAPISGTDVALPVKLLAVIALGSGKGSAVFERWREGKGWSYRQEGILWPTPTGFAPRFIMASADQTPLADLSAEMKTELEAAIADWTEVDLARARGMAEGILLRGFAMSPLYLNPGWPVGSSLRDETFLAAYWPMKTGTAWQPTRLLGQMALVSLSELKETAGEIVKVSIPRTIPAGG